MSDSVAQRVAAGGVAILVTTLLLVGVGTGAMLYREHVDALDQTLLAAAHARARPEGRRRVEIEHLRSPVDAWLVPSREHRLPDGLVEKAMHREKPLFADVGARRIVLLRFEIEDGHHREDDDHDEVRRLAAASAPKVTLADSVGPFALVYGLVSLLAAVVATLAQLQVVRQAFQPLERARDEADRVVGLGEGQRLTEAGPVEVRSLIEALNALLARLDDAYHAQSRFTAEAAHELRTPVTSMLGELDVALRGSGDAKEYRRVLASVREEVERLGQLVEGLTALARIDAGQTDRGRELMRAVELANNALKAEARTLDEAGCSVRLQVDDDPEIEAHRALLEVALSNLLRNAARHAPGSEVVLRVGEQGDLAVFEVDDAGPGVPMDQREALFDRFARAGDARRRDRAGLGLGLPIAREVAHRHGGDCVLLDSPLGGLRARLTVHRK